MKQFLVKLTLVGCVLAHAVADDLLSSEKKQLANDRSNDGEDDSESTVSSINAEAESQAARRAELLEKLEKVLEDIDFFDFDSNLLGIDDPRHARRRNTVNSQQPASEGTAAGSGAADDGVKRPEGPTTGMKSLFGESAARDEDDEASVDDGEDSSVTMGDVTKLDGIVKVVYRLVFT
jgi:hypothetical protein